MTVKPKSPADENGLLAALPSTIYERLKPNLTPVRLDAGSTLYDTGSRIELVWFITRGLVSLRTTTKDGGVIEAAAIGREGIVGLSGIARRNGTVYWAQVQISGKALQISASALRTAVGQGSVFYEFLFQYTYSLNEQISQEKVCSQFHTTEQRLARWLLTAYDRVSSDALVITHDNMAQTLGVSRSRISLAAGVLQRRGLIHYLRGHIRTLNRKGLEDASCECYRTISRAISYYPPI